jgi:hypothetical protein
VGIGTAGPGPKLDVIGTIRSAISGGTPILYLNNGATQHSIQNNSGVLGFYNDGTNQANIQSNGNLQFNSGYGSVATAYGCRAWVNFNGTTSSPSTIRASGNVTSVTKNGTGDYTINFTTAMPDANYSIVGTGQRNNTNQVIFSIRGSASYDSLTTTTARIASRDESGNSVDSIAACIAVFR